jgi:putative ABC transport system permease protein
MDEATRADIDLVRGLDQSLIDDLDAQQALEDGSHLVNLKRNATEAIAAAEKYAVTSVEVPRAFSDTSETVTVLGIDPKSTYWREVGVADGTVACGKGLLEKTVASLGGTCPLTDAHTSDSFLVRIDTANDNEADTQIYMSIHDFNLLFGNDEDYFCAYATDTALDLDERYVASTITPADTDELSAQMEESMGDIMVLMMAMAIPIYLILVYLLTKTVIDRSARSISYMKVFGYRDREVDRLYLLPITLAVLVSLVTSIPLIIWLMRLLLKLVFVRFAGNFPIIIPTERLALLVFVGMVSYSLVAVLHVWHIRRVSLSLAMRTQE